MSINPENREALWQEFMARSHVLELWTMKHDTEQARYGQIVQDLEAQEKHRQEIEQKIVEERRKWAMMSRSFSSKRRQRLQKGLDVLFSTARRVELSWANRVKREADFKRALDEYAQPGGFVFKWFTIRLGDFGDEDAREIAVHNTLHFSRYYFGSPGGRYIFRHAAAESSYFEEASRYSAAWNSLLENNHDELPQTYTFCGLVPRTLKEYTARFHVVCAKVAHLLGSIVVFTGHSGDELATFPPGKADSVTRTQLADLHDAWEKLVQGDDAKVRWAQEKTRTHTLILECAYLIAIIGHHVNAFLHQMKPLTDTLQLATGLHGERLVDDYDELLAREALHSLLQKRQVEQCVLISGDIEENIHDFFKAPRFIVDPLHPLNRFTRLDVQLALDQVETLSYLDQGDELSDSDSELSDPPDSVAELSELPDPGSELWTSSSPHRSSSPTRDPTSSTDHSLLPSPHCQDSRYPGHVGPCRIEEADVPIKVDGKDTGAVADERGGEGEGEEKAEDADESEIGDVDDDDDDDDDEADKDHLLGTKNTPHGLRRARPQLPARPTKRKRRLSSESFRCSRGC
ncbi:hypothetical protein E4U42_006096 [Claviceps africana]|uniref:Uncharacterized protein n=1 Tax=Claviceps africana TaxID=83212 RepID=A0A8K0J4V3_9HYPO|nr:hypothetical protein E4U42_006096 [Claviceps africana]